jgi:hypothetical protein
LRRMTRRRFALVLAAILFTPVAARARVVERVAAVVGDALVLASEVEDRVGPLMADVNKITDPESARRGRPRCGARCWNVSSTTS